MKLLYMKIDKISQHEGNRVIEIPAGGVIFTRGNVDMASTVPIRLDVNSEGKYNNLLRDIPFAVYGDDSLEVEYVLLENLFNVVVHDEVQLNLVNALLEN